jgi:RNA polymerase sigma-70 factor (ECF subfamily)
MGEKGHLIDRLDGVRDPLTAFCARLLWRGSEIEDALQETLLTAHRRFREFDGRDFRAWIFRIATLTCFNFNRRHARQEQGDGRRREPTLEEELEKEFTYDEILKNPAGVLDHFEDEIAKACSELPENERAILLLKSIGALSCSEIAKVLEIPLGTAQGLLTRARMKMRERLSEFATARGFPFARRMP